ncbi:MAG: GerMN domain-containing protein [Lachnospiraceae bacterium]|nr:GerMN domain-containing protein [Lachnospiraceae bacterium]
MSKQRLIGQLHIMMILLIASALLFTGCTKEAEKEEGTFNVYRLGSEGMSIVPEEVELSGLEGDTTGDLAVKDLLDELQEAPQDKALKSVLPGSVTVKDFHILDGQLVVNFSVEYLNMDKVREVLCRAALVRTLCQVETVDNVLLMVEGEPLTDADGNAVGHLTPDMFFDNAGNALSTYERTNLTLYFANETGDRLKPTIVECVYNSNISMDRLVVEKIIEGPKDDAEHKQGYPTVSKDTVINSVTTRDGVCYVNLGSGFLAHEYNVTPQVTIYSLVDSLTELADVNKVQISIEGSTEMDYMETIPLSQNFERNLEVVE